jgi:hypothetical protein
LFQLHHSRLIDKSLYYENNAFSIQFPYANSFHLNVDSMIIKKLKTYRLIFSIKQIFLIYYFFSDLNYLNQHHDGYRREIFFIIFNFLLIYLQLNKIIIIIIII